MFDLPIAVVLLGQEVVPADLVIVGLLIVLEGLLSIDNALVLGMLAKRLPKHMRARALSYGLIGAFVFRVIAILTAGFLLKYTFVKFLGGAYLVFIAVKHLFLEQSDGGEEKMVLDEDGNPRLVDAQTGESLDINRENIEIEQRVPVAAALVTQDGVDPYGTTYPVSAACDVNKHSMGLFWKTVLVIELTDIAFAVDSILAAMALAGSRQEKLWVVITGGVLGVVLMRFAAALFVRLLERFPRFEISAYLLVSIIGIKLLADWAFNSNWSFEGATWLGSWQPWFASLEESRIELVHAYESWLIGSWPLGMSEHAEGPIKAAPKLLDFHDFRRPECSGFWIVMLSCFFVGFLPKPNGSNQNAS
ncbi:TerC family protein [Pirellulaceae bacterium SH467]|jgi:YkoY family integral membrane protein